MMDKAAMNDLARRLALRDQEKATVATAELDALAPDEKAAVLALVPDHMLANLLDPPDKAAP